MTELEKIEYAKTFIDKLANGINPLDDSAIPDGDVVNNVRLSRCFFYVSGLLENLIKMEEKKKGKSPRVPFSLTSEELEGFEYTQIPIPITMLAKKIRDLAGDYKAKNMQRFSYRHLAQWLFDLGLIEWRQWENGKYKKFPTADGEEIGLVLEIWEKYGKRSPVIYFTEAAQHFIIDNIESIIATEPKSETFIKEEDSSEEENDE